MSRTMLLMFAILWAACIPVLAQQNQDPSPDYWWKLQNWETDFSTSNVPFSEINDVIERDQIPSIDAPQFHLAMQETRIPDIEPVVALDFGDEQRAYPIRYLMWHEIVNDVVAGTPLAITYCPLCNSAAVFERTIDGNIVTFGTTGKLRHSDLLMYDRGEQNWWQQFNGTAIVGARTGEKLTVIPSSFVSFGQYKQRYPDGTVLLPDSRRGANAGINPYVDYENSAFPFLFKGNLPTDINPMERVALVQSTQPPTAVAISFLNNNPIVKIGDLEFRWQIGQASALDTQVISQGRDIGTIEVFDVSSGHPELTAYLVTFAFAARAFYPDLAILQNE